MRPRREPPCTRPPESRRAGQRTTGSTEAATAAFLDNLGGRPACPHSRWGTSRSVRLVAVLLALGGLLGAACTGGDTGAATPVLGWYINPDNGGQAELAGARSAGGAVPRHGLDPAQRRLGAARAARPPAGGQGPVDRPHEPRPAVRGRVRRGGIPPAVHGRRSVGFHQRGAHRAGG